MATRPRAAQMSCRVNNPLTKRPGTWAALSTVNSPQPTTSRTAASSSQSKCATRRRSILSILAFFTRLLQVKVGLHDLPGDRRGDGPATGLGVFHQCRNGDLRRVYRRVGDEPGMVPFLPGKLRRLDALLSHLDHLR